MSYSLVSVDVPVPPNLASQAMVSSYKWGGGCSAWRYLARPDLSVTRESVPPRASEKEHTHFRGRQFFYILDGTAALEFQDIEITVQKGEGVEVPPGCSHRFVNTSNEVVEFPVVSSPGTKIDRVDKDRI